ncbi:MAG: ABC transporter substrate-binding protein [Betaproteobacteria bacterium]
MRRQLNVVLFFLCWAASAISAAPIKPEKPDLTIAVGGKSSLYYLPLTLAERLGYFKDEGLNVEIADFAGGSKALQAMMGGSADVTAGGFDHVVVLQARGQKVRAFVLLLRMQAISLAVAKDKAAAYHSAKDLRGMKIGVTAPGSSTHLFVNRVLASAGLTSDDVSIIGVGNGATAAAAMRSGQIDAIANVEPVITMLERAGAIKVVAEAITETGSRAVYGELLPAGCLYTKEEFIRGNPNTVQALTNAIVRALRWLQNAKPEDIAKTVPPEYLMGERDVYLAALQKSRESYSKDGLVPAAGAQTLYNVLRTFDPAVKEAAQLKTSQTFDNAFVQRVPARAP